MKNITQLTFSVLTLVALSACSYTNQPSESQKNALNSISSDSQPAKKGAMQTSLDKWIKQEWSPTVEKDEKIQKKYMKAKIVEGKTDNNSSSEIKYTEDPNRNFTLQEYVDKAGVYMKAHENDKTESNVKKLDSMPVIGN